MAFFSCSDEPLIEREISEQLVLSKSESPNFPAIIDLPDDSYPEGIVLGNGNDLHSYV